MPPQKRKVKHDTDTSPNKQIKSKQTDLSSFMNIEKKSNDLFDLGDGKIDQNNIKISSWNVNGIRAVENKDNHFSKYIDQNDPDIICLGELKISQNKFDKDSSIKQYLNTKKYPYQYLNFCKPPIEGYSGTGILSKFKPISVQYDLKIQKHDQEGRTTLVEFEKFYLVTCYVPNAGQKLVRLDYRTKEWDIDFKNYLLKLQEKKNVILCGDLNVAHKEIDIANPKTNLKSAGFTVEERQNFTDLLNSGFKDTFREKYPETVKYSWWSYRTGGRAKNVGWRLDYFLINDTMNMDAIQDSMINNDAFGSDHCPVELLLDLKKL